MPRYKIEGTEGMQIPFEGKTYTLLEDIHYELDDIFFEFTFGQSADVIARKEFCPISLEAEIAWENPAEVAWMYWDVPYGELKEFINSGNFAKNIDGILSYEATMTVKKAVPRSGFYTCRGTILRFGDRAAQAPQ